VGAIVIAGLFLIPLVRSSYHQWALAYQDARKYDRAAALLDRAERLLPDDVGSRLGFHRGKLDFEAGDLKDAEARFRTDMARFPCYPEGFGNLGVVYGVRAMNGDHAALATAQDWIGKALRLRPGGKEAATDYNSLGNIRVLAGNERGALESYREALRCDDEFVEPAVNAARLLMKHRRHAEAAEIVRAVLAKRPSDPDLQRLALALGVHP
jgi:tetratricopeptide (TPR) repeat protein